jgi:hypothetical protein
MSGFLILHFRLVHVLWLCLPEAWLYTIPMITIPAFIPALMDDLLKIMEWVVLYLKSELLCKDFIIKPQGSFLYVS